MQLPPDIEARIQAKIATGRYRSSEEVLQKALAILDQVEGAEEDIRTNIAIGLEQLDRGEGIPAEQVFAGLRLRSEGLAGP